MVMAVQSQVLRICKPWGVFEKIIGNVVARSGPDVKILEEMCETLLLHQEPLEPSLHCYPSEDSGVEEESPARWNPWFGHESA